MQQPKANFWANPVSSDKVCLYIFWMYIIRSRWVWSYTLGQFKKFKMATNMTENLPIFKNKTRYANKMLFITFSNMRSIMVLLILRPSVFLFSRKNSK